MEVIPACMQFLYTNRPLAVFSRCLQKGSFSYLQCSACTQSFSSSVEVLCCIFHALGKKIARETKSGKSSHLSHISPSPCLLLSLLTVSTFNCNLQPLLHLVSHCSLCLFTVLIRWAGRWWVYLGPWRPAMSYLSDMLEQRQCLLFIVF